MTAVDMFLFQHQTKINVCPNGKRILSQYQMFTATPTGFTHKSIRLLPQASFIISSETFWISTVQQIITDCYYIIFVHYDIQTPANKLQ